MNNPFPNFSTNSVMLGLSNLVQQPMFVAVAASAVVHGLVFVALPAVTTPVGQQKDPERVVSVIELTPEEQARLPQAVGLNQLPLPTDAMGQLPPLSGVSPESTQSNGGTFLPPLNPAISDILKQSGQPQDSFVPDPGPLFKPVPVPQRVIFQTPKPEPKPDPPKKAEKPAPQPEKTPELPNLEKTQTLPDKPKMPPGTQDTNPQPTPSASPLPDGGAKSLAGTQPATTPMPQGFDPIKRQQEAQQRLAARTYSAVQTTREFQVQRQAQITNGVLQKLDAQLQELPEPERAAIARDFGLAANGMDQPVKFEPATPQLLPGETLRFSEERPQEVMTVVQAYFAPNGALIPAVEEEGRAIVAPVIMRSSGFKVLDDQALAIVKKKIEANRPTGKYQTIRYEIPFKLPQTGEA